MTDLIELAPRIVRCRIEMNLIEGQHFNFRERNFTDTEALADAAHSFLDLLQNADHIADYVQVKLIEEVS